MFKGQIFQDRFVLSMLNYKNNGYFIEIGSNDPIRHNNTYILENNFNWKGIMIEYDKKWYELYKNIKCNPPDGVLCKTHFGIPYLSIYF